REKLALVMIANRNYEGEITAARRFATVNVAVPATVATRNVTPDVVPPAVTAVTPTSIAVTLDTWREAPFAMDDKGMQRVDRGIIPTQSLEAAKALANYIENQLWAGLGPAVYGWAGIAGTTPFATDTSEYLDARKIGNNQLMDIDPRFMVIDTDAEANALGLRAFQDASFGGGANVIVNGQIGTKLGATWLMSQLVPTHTAGTNNGAAQTDATGYAIGLKSVTMDNAGTGSILVNDIITFANHAQTYVVTTGDADVSSGAGTLSFLPGLTTALPSSNVVITTKGASSTWVKNLLVHRDLQTFAMAPLLDGVQVPGATLQAVAIDEASGLSLRLEVTRQHKQVQWSYDALFGHEVIRGTHGVWLAG
ncbi:hypothetical protein LCGC14_2526900, partial [marine sediment metagenome]